MVDRVIPSADGIGDKLLQNADRDGFSRGTMVSQRTSDRGNASKALVFIQKAADFQIWMQPFLNFLEQL